MLHVRESGQGHAVLLLHAFPMSSRMWVAQLAALKRNARLIAPDFPGFGSSPLTSPPSIDDYAAGVLEVLDHLRIDEVVVGGLSMGGYVAFRLIEKLGARLRGLLLADTRATADSPDAALVRHELASQVEASGVEVAAREFLPKLLGITTQRANRALVDRVHAIMLENSVAGVAAALRAMAARPDSTPLLSKIDCPVMCVAGDEDTITPPEVARHMASLATNGRAAVIEHAGHLSNLEAPEAFSALLDGFITQCFPARAVRKRSTASKAGKATKPAKGRGTASHATDAPDDTDG